MRKFSNINKIAELFVKAQNHKYVEVNNKSYTVDKKPGGEYRVTKYGVIATILYTNGKITSEQGNKQILDQAKVDVSKFPVLQINENVKRNTIENRSYVTTRLADGSYKVDRFGPLGYVEFNNNDILAEVGNPETIIDIKQDMYKFPKNLFG